LDKFLGVDDFVILAPRELVASHVLGVVFVLGLYFKKIDLMFDANVLD
jgi:hypothetical protein